MKGKSNRWVLPVVGAVVVIVAVVLLVNRHPGGGGASGGGGAALDMAAVDAMIPPLPDSYWKPTQHSSISDLREASDRSRMIYATLSADQRATLLKTGSFALEGARATPQQTDAIRSLLDSSEHAALARQFLGDPPDISKVTCILSRGQGIGKDYLFVGWRNVIGQSYSGHPVAPWPSGK